jgi:hypothetical protein
MQGKGERRKQTNKKLQNPNPVPNNLPGGSSKPTREEDSTWAQHEGWVFGTGFFLVWNPMVWYIVDH